MPCQASRSRHLVTPVTTLLILGLACGPDAPRAGRTPSGLAWETTGRGPAVVLVHGAMLDRRQWNPQRPLSDRFTVIRYDTRWHGASAGADRAFRGADDLAQVLDAAGVDQASVVGLSNGARIAVDFALAYPRRVKRLVLISPGLEGYVPVERPAFWGPLIAALQEGAVDRAAQVLAASPVMAVGTEDTAWVAAMVREHAGVFRQDPTRETRADPPAIRRLADIEAPTLVITGDADIRDIVLTGDTLEQGIPGARRVTIEGARHLLSITHAAQVNQLLIAFLSDKPSR